MKTARSLIKQGPPYWVRIVWLMPAVAYYLLQKAILRKQGSESLLANALGADIKGKISPVLYAAAILLAFVLVPGYRSQFT